MKSRWHDWSNFIFGGWLFLSPWLMQYASLGAASWNSMLFGGAIVFFATWALLAPAAWEEWTNLVLGIWLIVAPWVLGFSSQVFATWNIVGVGVVVSVLSAAALLKGTPTPVTKP